MDVVRIAARLVTRAVITSAAVSRAVAAAVADDAQRGCVSNEPTAPPTRPGGHSRLKAVPVRTHTCD